MVMKIHQSREQMTGVLQYNQKKVVAGDARIIGFMNVPNGTVAEAMELFDRLERRNIRTEKISFQMSINPNPAKTEETLTDEEVRGLAGEVMTGLGYGDQPVIIYQHDDISRTHYHIVSIRVNEQGRKVNDRFEQRKLQRLMQRLSKDYHYKIGSDEMSQFISHTVKNLPRFNKQKGDLLTQYQSLFDKATEYQFTTPTQFMVIMKGLGVNLIISELVDYSVSFQGLDDKGNPNTEIINQEAFGRNFFREIQAACERNSEKREKTPEERKEAASNRYRIAKTVTFCLGISRSQKHFERMLEKKGITVHLSRTKDDGDIFGTTFVDQLSRQAYKGSDLDRKGCAIQVFQDADGRWKENAVRAKEEWMRQKQEERKEQRAARHREMVGRMVNDMYNTKDPEELSYLEEMTDFAMDVLDDMIGTGELYKETMKQRRRAKKGTVTKVPAPKRRSGNQQKKSK